MRISEVRSFSEEVLFFAGLNVLATCLNGAEFRF